MFITYLDGFQVPSLIENICRKKFFQRKILLYPMKIPKSCKIEWKYFYSSISISNRLQNNVKLHMMINVAVNILYNKYRIIRIVTMSSQSIDFIYVRESFKVRSNTMKASSKKFKLSIIVGSCCFFMCIIMINLAQMQWGMYSYMHMETSEFSTWLIRMSNFQNNDSLLQVS